MDKCLEFADDGMLQRPRGCAACNQREARLVVTVEDEAVDLNGDRDALAVARFGKAEDARVLPLLHDRAIIGAASAKSEVLFDDERDGPGIGGGLVGAGRDRDDGFVIGRGDGGLDGGVRAPAGADGAIGVGLATVLLLLFLLGVGAVGETKCCQCGDTAEEAKDSATTGGVEGKASRERVHVELFHRVSPEQHRRRRGDMVPN